MSQEAIIDVGVRNAKLKRGFDEARAEAKKFSGEFKKDIGRDLLGAFSFGAIMAGFDSLLEKFGRIQDLSDRFGETQETIQRVGSAAQQDGADIEMVAKALTKITIEAGKAASGVDENAQAFTDLGINAAQFLNLSMDEKLIELSKAYERASGNTLQMAKFSDFLGTKMNDLIPLLAEGSEGLKTAFAAVPVVANDAVAAIDAMGDSLTRTKEYAAVAAVWVTDLAARFVSLHALQWDLLSGKGMQASWANFKGANAEITKSSIEKKKGPNKEAAIQQAELASEGKKKAKEVEDLKKIKDELAKDEARARREALDDEDRLQAIYADRNALLKKANETTVEGVQAKREALALDVEAQKLSTTIIEKEEARGKKRAELRAKQQDALKAALADEAQTRRSVALEKMTPTQKAAALRKEQQQLAREAQSETKRAAILVAYRPTDSERTRADALRASASAKRKKGLELETEIDGLTKDKSAGRLMGARVSVVADSMRSVGGGGHADRNGIRDHAQTITKLLRSIDDGVNNKRHQHQPLPATASGLQGRGGLHAGHLSSGHL